DLPNGGYTIGSQTPPRPAAEALGRIGPEAKAAGLRLTPMLKSEQKLERFAAAEALWDIDQQGKPGVPVLIGLLLAKDLRPGGNYIVKSRHRPQVAAVLGRIGPEAKEAVPALLSVIKEEDAGNAKRSVWITPVEDDEEDKREDEYRMVRRAGLEALR